MSNDQGILEGQVLAGKYQVERVLGRGGMGFVVAARHIKLNDRVALKFLLPHAACIPEVVERFAREARAAVRIKSEHVARVTDVGELEDGSPYMVMEHLEGVDLSELLRQGMLPVQDAVEFVLQACEAIAEAHALGIVHRDLKPANLFLAKRVDGSPCIKVLDFGISKMSAFGGAPGDAALTATQSVMGSPQYMSPEQMISTKQVDVRADIWALGAILYELLTGNPAFVGETLGHLAILIAQQPPHPMRAVRPELAAGLEAIVLRCLEKDAARRYANVAELAVALADFGPRRARISAERVSRVLIAAGLGSSSASSLPPPSSGPVSPVTQPTTTGVSWGEKTRDGAPRRRGPMLAGAVLALLAAIAATGWFASRRTTPTADLVASSSPVVPSVAAVVTTPPLVAPLASNAAFPASNRATAAAPTASAQAATIPVASPRPAQATRGKVAASPHSVPTQPIAAPGSAATRPAPAVAAPPKPAGNFDWGDRP